MTRDPGDPERAAAQPGVSSGRAGVSGIAASTWLGLAAAGTIGALFGTPVAAALIRGSKCSGTKTYAKPVLAGQP
ncbi:hypothetical protein ACFXJ8_34375 [Nonomuraea sp. NPDC059194]|uniref:hypothetical protein n=1 Tax=Nonomuraea sp. NPDC059194 TaxID=3346764 RepID=UPI0036C4FB34